MFKNKTDGYMKGAGHVQMNKSWTLDKSMSSLSTCHQNRDGLNDNPVKIRLAGPFHSLCGKPNAI